MTPGHWYLRWYVVLGVLLVICAVLVRVVYIGFFQIPSGAMLPTLVIGDFIYVDKTAYGVRLPFLYRKVVETGSPKRGDVIVFRYPVDPSLVYIKRVIGLPGDKVAYINKRISINGIAIPLEPTDPYVLPGGNRRKLSSFEEQIGEHTHQVLLDDRTPQSMPFVREFPYREKCTYSIIGITCVVPPDHYFVMGDNRDNSADSRVWGFVPDRNVVGEAIAIWWNSNDPKRSGMSIR